MFIDKTRKLLLIFNIFASAKRIFNQRIFLAGAKLIDSLAVWQKIFIKKEVCTMKSMSPKKLFSCVGQAHEFELAMIKAGVKASQIQDVINGRLKFNFSSIGNFVENKYLNLISSGETLIIDQCDGKQIISNASDIFAYIDPDFRNYKADEVGQATFDMPVSVYGLIKNGAYADIFGSFSVENEKLCLTQDQIIGFVRKNRGWLRTDGYGTFFVFKSYGNFFVAHVYVHLDGTLRVNVRRLEDDGRWRAEYHHRFVVPQLAA